MNETVSRLLDAYRAEFTEKLQAWVSIVASVSEARMGNGDRTTCYSRPSLRA